jgi:hypothetical protein
VDEVTEHRVLDAHATSPAAITQHRTLWDPHRVLS